jgi:glycerophosphoryl diester phosphodiesterase
MTIHPSPSAGRASALIATLLVAAASLGSVPTPAAARAVFAGCGGTAVASHATAKKYAPENSVAGIRITAEQGASVVEADQRFSRSGQSYLLHDDTLDRTTTATGKLADTWVSQLGNVSAADHAPWNIDPLYAGNLPTGKPKTEVPYVYDYLKAVKDNGLTFLVDAKVLPTKAQADMFMSYVDRPEFQLRSKLLYMGSYDHVKQMNTWYPDLTYGVIEYPPNDGTKALRVYTPENLKAIGASFYAVPFQYLRPGLVGYMHEQDVQVFTWTSDGGTWENGVWQTGRDHIGNWQQAYQWGVDMLITNDPAGALAACLPGL